MKTKKIFAAGLGLLASATLLTGCLNNDNENSYTQSLSPCVNVIFSANDNAPMYAYGAGYSIKYNLTSAMSKVTMEGLNIPQLSASYTSLEFPETAFAYVNGWKKIGLTNVTPSSATAAPQFDYLNVDVLDRYVLGSYHACYNINFAMMGGQYMGYSLPAVFVSFGSTVVVADGGDTFTQSDSDFSIYLVDLSVSDSAVNLNDPDKRKCSFYIYNAKFNSNDAGSYLLLPDIHYDVDNAGYIHFSVAEANPYQIGSNSETTLLTNYKVKNLTYYGNTANNTRVDFTCDITNTSSGATTTYDWHAVCSTPYLE